MGQKMIFLIKLIVFLVYSLLIFLKIKKFRNFYTIVYIISSRLHVIMIFMIYTFFKLLIRIRVLMMKNLKF